MIDAETIAERLEGRACSGGWMARCPAHEDKRSSLSIGVGRDGRVLLRCHAGCKFDAIAGALGIAVADLMPPRVERSRIVATYDYRDESGALLYQAVRYAPKDFRQRRPGGSDGWIWKLGDVRRVPYRLPELLASTGPVFSVEGEKDADALVRLGLVATTNAGGAETQWPREWAQHFAGRDVYVIPDNDGPGRKHADQVAATLQGKSASVRVVELPGLPAKGDVSDWLKAGGTAAQLLELAESDGAPAGRGDAWEPPCHGDDDAPPDVRACSEAGEETPWPPREKLGSGDVGVPSLSPDLVPRRLLPWLADVADHASFPLEMPTIPAMVALSSIVGRKVGIRPDAYGHWTVVPNLWGGIVARPGWKKSHAIEAGVSPLGHLVAKARDDHERRRADVEALRLSIESQIKAEQRRKPIDAQVLADLIRERDRTKVTQRRYLTSDATVEKLGEILRDNPRGILLCRDELAGWITAMSRADRAGDREFYLEAWGGTGSFTVDRIGRGTIHIPALCLSVIGSIQPAKLMAHVRAAVGAGAMSDGLLQRIQLLAWPDRLPDYHAADRRPDSEARAEALRVFDELDGLDPAGIGAEVYEDGIPFLRFDREAQDAATAWETSLELRLRTDELASAPAFESHIAKYRSLMPSLALLIHLVERADGGPVGVDCVQAAIAWCAFLELHARKVYAVELAPHKAAAELLASKIESRAIDHGTRVRDLNRAGWEGLKTPEAINSGLRELERVGWVRVVSEATGGRPSIVVCLHPDLRCP